MKAHHHVSYCVNPECKHRQNPDRLERCQACGTPLLVEGRYRLVKPLRKFHPLLSTEIFEIRDRETPKVMKVLKDDIPQLVKMFAREVAVLHILQTLKHPGIPRVEADGYFKIEVGEGQRTLHCLVMEKIEGQDLEQWLAANKGNKIILSERQALDWLKQLFGILQVLHEFHYSHRDIKPSNIVLKPDGQLVLIDFGSVRPSSLTYLRKSWLGKVTAVISGGYTPQEQMDGKASPQSDLFALGRTFVHLLTGKSPMELPTNSKGRLIWRDRSRHISKPLADFIDELIALDPGDRPQNTAAILPQLTPGRLWKRRWQRKIIYFIKSRLFQIVFAVAVTLSITGTIIYILSRPALSEYYKDKGLQAHQGKNIELAIEYYNKALEFNPNHDAVYHNLGFICRNNKKDLACAQRNFEKALEINPAYDRTRFYLGMVYEDSGNLDAAEAQYKALAQSDSDDAVYGLSNWARLRIIKQDPVMAIDLSSQGLEKTDRPKVLAALYKNRGWARWMLGDYEQAKADLQKAIDSNPERTDAYCLLAQVLEAQGNPEAALAEWQECLNRKIVNSDIDVRIWQTMARQRLNDAGKKP